MTRRGFLARLGAVAIMIPALRWMMPTKVETEWVRRVAYTLTMDAEGGWGIGCIRDEMVEVAV